jgi:predicted alpha/beta-fold hydrolase
MASFSSKASGGHYISAAGNHLELPPPKKAKAVKLQPIPSSIMVALTSSEGGERAGPQVDIPTSSTPKQLEALLNSLLARTNPGEALPYAFYVNNVEVRVATERVQYLDANGVKIRYIDTGRGKAIVLLHGGASSLESWTSEGLVDNLAKDFRVIAFDARGHGKSDSPRDPAAYGRQQALDVVRILDALKIQRAHIIGFSLGSSTVAQLLTLHPEPQSLLAQGSGSTSTTRQLRTLSSSSTKPSLTVSRRSTLRRRTTTAPPT